MLFPFIYISTPLQFPKCTSSSSYLKVLMDVFHIQYTNIEATLHAWRPKTLFKTVVPWGLTPHQMFRFYHEFGIIDTTTWSDLSYDRAESILRTMKEENIQVQVDSLAPNPPNTNSNLTSESNEAPILTSTSTSRPKKREARFLSVYTITCRYTSFTMSIISHLSYIVTLHIMLNTHYIA